MTTGLSAGLAVGLAAASVFVLVATPRLGPRRLVGLLSAPAPLRTPRPGPALLGLGTLVVAGPIAALLAVVAAVALDRLRRRRQAAAAWTVERRRALEALAILAADLRAGRPGAEALTAAAAVAAGATAASLTAAAASARLGGDVVGALTSGPCAVPEVLRGLAACWAVCSSTGSGLAAGVERLEEGLRAAEAQRRAVAGELAGPRATAALLAVLPVGGVGLAAALGAEPLQVLLHTPIGLGCLLLGLGLDAAGLAWTGRLVARAAAP